MSKDPRDKDPPIDATFGFDSNDEWLDHLKAAESRGEIGRLGAYRIIEEAEMGGQGVVYRAIQPETHRQVALKRLRDGKFSSERARQRFEREIEAMSALSHPGIVSVFGVERIDGLPILAMEWIDGQPITKWLAQRHLSTRSILRLVLEVSEAIHHAHVKGILHRDIKPSNILVDGEGHAHVLDFGLAKFVSEKSGRPTLTEAGGFLGTPAYASPESLQGGSDLDVRSDVYSLGILLYEMLTDTLPYGETSLIDRARQQAAETMTLPSTRKRGIPRELDAILVKALRYSPDQRFQSAEAFAEDIRRFLAHEPVSAHPPSSWYELRTLVRRHRVAFAFATFVATALAAFAVDRGIHARNLQIAQNREHQARKKSELEEEKALAEAKRSRAILNFFLDDLIVAGNPYAVFERRLAHAAPPTVVDVINAGARQIEGKFQNEPHTEIAIRWALGRTLLGLQETDRGVEMLESALATYKRHALPADALEVQIRLRLGEGLIVQGKEALGMTTLETALAQLGTLENPAPFEWYNAHMTLALVKSFGNSKPREQQEHIEEALRVFDKIDWSYPSERDAARRNAMGSLAQALVQQGQTEEAKEIYDQLLEQPLDAMHRSGVLFHLGRLELSQGQNELAAERFTEALSLLDGELPAGHVHFNRTLFDLARAVAPIGTLEDLRTVVRESLRHHRIRKEGLRGIEDVLELETQRNLAEQLMLARLHADAVEVAKETHAAARSLLGKDDLRVLLYLTTYGKALFLAEQKDEAGLLFGEGVDCVFRASADIPPNGVNAVTLLVVEMYLYGFHDLGDLIRERAMEFVLTTGGQRTDYTRNFLTVVATRLDRTGEPERAALIREQVRALPPEGPTILTPEDLTILSRQGSPTTTPER